MSFISVNKKIVTKTKPCIRLHDRGFTLGHGLFETMLIQKCSVFAFNYHWRRLRASAECISMDLPFSSHELLSMIRDLIVKNKLQDRIASARVTISHGESERGLLPQENPIPNSFISVFEYDAPRNPSYSAQIVKMRKNEASITSRIKSLSYLDNILAKKEALEKGYDEAILLNSMSNVADGACSNVFMVKNNQIFTPPLSDGALPGVIRAILLEEFNEDFSFIETSISPSELLLADEVFLTNVLLGVKSVNRLGLKIFHEFPLANDIRVALKRRKHYPSYSLVQGSR